MDLDVGTLIEGGSTGIAIACLVLIYFIIKKQFKKDEKVLGLFENHINHNTEVLTKLNELTKQGIKINEEIYIFLRRSNGRK